MHRLTKMILAILILSPAGLFAIGCSSGKAAPEAAPLPPAVTIATNEGASLKTIRFFEDRIKRDPDDFIAINRLAALYLQRLRETGSVDYLRLASKTAQASLNAMPAEQNLGGLSALALSEYASHQFAETRDHALQLAKLDPGKSYPYQMLGDAYLELGEYEDATRAYNEMSRLGVNVSAEARLGRFALLKGDVNTAQKYLAAALALAADSNAPDAEAVAWCRWQLGEIAFSVGDYPGAEKDYRDSLTVFPGYYRALGSLGRALAARGDRAGAIDAYEQAVRVVPDPVFIAALGDLYQLAGDEKKASDRYQLVEQISHLSELNGTIYNRLIAIFYADHDMKPDLAFENARKEYDARHDIYGADALAWAALKAGKLSEAQAAIKAAQSLGTKDAKILFHAGLIARATGDTSAARQQLERALKLNPQFDPLQAPIAVKNLNELKGAM